MKVINYIKAISNILKATLKAINKMNTITEFIVNDYVGEIINNVFDLSPPTQMIRLPSHNAAYEETPLIVDGSFEDFQNASNDFVMPEPCVNCYTFSCNAICCEEMELPPPRPLTRINTNAHLPDDEPEKEEIELPPPRPLTRMNTNAHLPEDEEQDK